MKNIIIGIFLLLSASLTQAQTPNYYRNPDKISGLQVRTQRRFLLANV